MLVYAKFIAGNVACACCQFPGKSQQARPGKRPNPSSRGAWKSQNQSARSAACCRLPAERALGRSRFAQLFRLETVHLHGRGLETQTFLLVREELLNILALVALELDDLTHLGVAHDGAIASELLLDHLKDLLLVELLGETLDSGQGLATVTL